MNELSLPLGRTLNTPASRARRKAMIDEAVSWPRPDWGKSSDLRLYDVEDRFSVGVRVPGKEADPARKYVNPFDMLPAIWVDGEVRPFDSGFSDICRALFDLGAETRQTRGEEGARAFGALLYRSAWAFDHAQQGAVIRYRPPDGPMSLVRSLPWVRVQTPSTEHDFPVTIFLYFLELLALNEDIKYWYRNKTLTETGRPNTLRTCARALACGLGLDHPMNFAYALMRMRGVASMTRAQGIAFFPALGE